MENLELTLIFDNVKDMATTMKYVKRMDKKHSITGGYYGQCSVRLCENTLELMSDEERQRYESASRYVQERES